MMLILSSTVFFLQDSFRELFRRGKGEMRSRMYVVFEGEEGQDAGGLLREWYIIVAREIFNPNYALFKMSPGDRVTYMPNPSSYANPEHLSYFRFVGRFIAKAIFDDKLLECYFTRSFYKHILGKPVVYTDMEKEDFTFYKGLDSLLKSDMVEMGLELTFCVDVSLFGRRTCVSLSWWCQCASSFSNHRCGAGNHLPVCSQPINCQYACP